MIISARPGRPRLAVTISQLSLWDGKHARQGHEKHAAFGGDCHKPDAPALSRGNALRDDEAQTWCLELPPDARVELLKGDEQSPNVILADSNTRVFEYAEFDF
jgi:hypothetical protein